MEKGATSGADERRWRKTLKKLGAAAVRRQLQQPVDDVKNDTIRSPTDTGSPDPPRQFVDAWYREAQQKAQRAKNSRTFMLALFALATVAAGIIFLTVL